MNGKPPMIDLCTGECRLDQYDNGILYDTPAAVTRSHSAVDTVADWRERRANRLRGKRIGAGMTTELIRAAHALLR